MVRAQAWGASGYEPLSYGCATNKGLSQECSRLMASKSFQTRRALEQSRFLKTCIRNDPVEIRHQQFLEETRPRERPNSAMDTTMTLNRRSRSAGSLSDVVAPNQHVDPYTGKSLKPDPHARRFFSVGRGQGADLSMGIQEPYLGEEGKAVHLAPRFGVGKPCTLRGRNTPIAMRIHSTGDLSASHAMVRQRTGRTRCGGSRPGSAPQGGRSLF
eukprot:TRINITY_DN26012_c5_g1_i1.p1 TRINITY_DN26012_c5_g1~~TRINITY_DN26012_c5_g1_i1.p1  ORF type:complete len:214 (+),score=19.43 TRINITY_DN26012_c5_g1_i1:25-666(+)